MNNSMNAILNFSCQARLFLITRLNDLGLKLIEWEVLKCIIKIYICTNKIQRWSNFSYAHHHHQFTLCGEQSQ
jgi:hypothetical protein